MNIILSVEGTGVFFVCYIHLLQSQIAFHIDFRMGGKAKLFPSLHVSKQIQVFLADGGYSKKQKRGKEVKKKHHEMHKSS